MPVDPEEGLVTDLMLGLMVAFGADIILLVGALWLIGITSTATFVTTTGLIVAAFAAWIGWRWWAIRTFEPTDAPERSAVDELKHRYAAGEIDEAEFERQLDRLVEIEDRAEGPDADDLATDRAE